MLYKYLLTVVSKLRKAIYRRTGARTHGHRCARPTLYLCCIKMCFLRDYRCRCFLPHHNTSKFLNAPLILYIPYLLKYQYFEKKKAFLRSLLISRFLPISPNIAKFEKVVFFANIFKNINISRKYLYIQNIVCAYFSITIYSGVKHIF